MIFLFEFTMSHKSTDIIHNINNALAQELLNGWAVQSWFKKFCKGDESLEDEESSGQPSAGDNKQLRAVIETNPLTTTWEVVKELSVNNSTVTRLLKQLERWKSSISRYLMNWPKIKKIVLKCLFLLFYKTMNHFSIRLWHVTKSGFYTTTSNDQLSGWTGKKLQSTFPKSNLHPKKSWSLYGGLLAIWPTTAYWIPAKLLRLRSMLNKSMRCTESRNTCSQH